MKASKIAIEELFDELLDVPLKPGPRRFLKELYEKYQVQGNLGDEDTCTLLTFYNHYCVPDPDDCH